MLARFGSGGFGTGYSASLDADDGTYGPVKLAGRKVSIKLNGRDLLQQMHEHYSPAGLSPIIKSRQNDSAIRTHPLANCAESIALQAAFSANRMLYGIHHALQHKI